MKPRHELFDRRDGRAHWSWLDGDARRLAASRAEQTQTWGVSKAETADQAVYRPRRELRRWSGNHLDEGRADEGALRPED
jgi:hypothetical protein